ncbi:hypothetical protein PPH41_37735, partial [Burkholderia gladioli]|nr:hypothetical protein [Burkholderia gladioli]
MRGGKGIGEAGRRRASAQGAGGKRDSTGSLRRGAQAQGGALVEPVKKQIEQSARAASEQPLTAPEAEIAASYVGPWLLYTSDGADE